jgi:NADPH:quinone reductase-like Zn-dependent oxidoreductase
MKNRRVVITRHGGPEVLQVVEDELREPGPGEVQLRVLASGVAFGDVMKRLGFVPRQPPLPYTPGYDLVGVVERTGAGAGRFRPGDRVAGLVGNGANAERANVPERRLVAVPPGVDAAEALCCVLNYVTAWQMLHRVARVAPGERILVHGAAGGVGTALLQLGRLAGLEQYGTASLRKHAVVAALGAHPIDYRSEDFVKAVRKLGPGGVDVVFDPVGGSHLSRSHRVLRRAGRLVAYGVSAAASGEKRQILLTFLLLGLYKLLPDGRRIRLFGIGATGGSGEATIAEDLTRLLALLAERKIAPVVGARLPLEEAARAHRMLDCAEVAGKIVLVAK